MRLYKHLDLSLTSDSSGKATMGQKTPLVFMCLYLGYMVITYIRKSVSFAAPVIMQSETIGKSQLGLILSSQMVGYSIGKLLGGVLVDMVSPSRVFTAALLLSGITVMAFTVFHAVSMFTLLWFVNGLSQGPSWPSCALLIKRWFPAESFGTWWSLLSTSMNVSGTVGPLVSAFFLAHYSWRFSLNSVGFCAVALAGVSMMYLTDSPHQESAPSPKKSGKESSKSAISWKEGVKGLLAEPVFLGVSLNYLLVSLVRGANTDWGQMYLIVENKHSHLTGSSYISSQELGGIFGSLFSGYVSDYFVLKKNMPYNPRLMVMLMNTVIQSFFVFLFITSISSTSSPLWITTVGFCTGFGVFGSIAMFGVVAMESTTDRLSGTAHSLASLAANVGMVLSGLPLSLVARQHSWYAAFVLVLAVSMSTVGVALFCVLRSATVKATQKKRDT